MRNLLQLIQHYDLRSKSDLYRYGILDSFRKDLRSELEKCNSILANGGNGKNFCMPLSVGEMLELNRHGYASAAQKLSIYCDKPLLYFPAVPFPKSIKETNKSREYTHKLIKRVEDNVIFPIRNMESLIRHNIVDVLPRGIGKNVIVKVNDSYESITLSQKTLKANLFPNEKIKFNRGVFLYLPYMTTVDPKEYYEFKAKYQNDFHQFRCYLDKFLIESENTDSTQRLLELMRDVNEGILSLRGNVEEHTNNVLRKGVQIVTGLVTVSLSLIAPDQIATELFRAIGGVSAFNGVWEYIESKKTLSVKKSDYYVPWLISKELEQNLSNE